LIISLLKLTMAVGAEEITFFYLGHKTAPSSIQKRAAADSEFF
jgi:hypothetical protein